MVVVAPVLRFKEVGINANITVRDLAPPENIIAGGRPRGCPLLVYPCSPQSHMQSRAAPERLPAYLLASPWACRVCAGAVWQPSAGRRCAGHAGCLGAVPTSARPEPAPRSTLPLLGWL